MKKVLLTMMFATLLPVVCSNSGVNCYAEDYHPKDPMVSDAIPIYYSYYNSHNQKLYIYGCESITIITLKVMHNGSPVLTDLISPSAEPAIYDFSGAGEGTFQVFISTGDIVLGMFTFER